MKLTNEEIEGAREEIVALLMQCFSYPMRVRTAAKQKLDALCAAASQESLVGKRVRFKTDRHEHAEGCIAWMDSPSWHIRKDGIEGTLYRRSRTDFVVLEGDDA